MFQTTNQIVKAGNYGFQSEKNQELWVIDVDFNQSWNLY